MKVIDIKQLEAIVFDFDGVLTDDRVFVDQDGGEMVCCTRSDGIAFDILRKTKLTLFILTTEKNPVVARRAEKLRVPAVCGVANKLDGIIALARENRFALERTLYVGNDVNDYHAMKACGFSACPSDSHPQIQALANFVLKKAGGQGVVREIVESVLGLDALKEWHNR